MRSKAFLVVALLSVMNVLAIDVAHADGEPAVPAPYMPTVGDLKRIQAETIIAKARANLAKIEASLPARAPAAEDPNAKGLPAVQLVDGSANRLVATLVYPSGAVFVAKTGDAAPGGYHVDAVGTTTVVLSRAGQQFKLGFSNRAEQVPAEQQSIRQVVPLAYPPQTAAMQ